MMNFGIRIEFILGSLLLFLPTGNASITVLSTGNQYDSRADDRLGKTFWKGYEYSARLQYVIGNYDACDTSREMWNITVPQDGVPVAILVRHDGCSLEQKARFVSQYLYPPNIVKYMIVDGDGSLSATEDSDDQTLLEVHEEDGFIDDHASSMEKLQLPGWSLKGDDITVGIMHVSTKSGQKLLASIFADKTHKAGPRIMIDGGVSDVGNREVFLWMALSALLSACACIFMLAAHNGTINFLQREQENQQHPQRPQRRRLTREQVRKLFPRFEFDGSGLRPGVRSSGVLNADGFPYVTSIAPPTPLEMTCCSICLDDYEPGDRLRVLPCNHAFHARCIGKWLAERSATCPLCKMEIWDDEDEQSDSDEEEAATAEESTPSTGTRDPMTSQLWNMLRFQGETSQEQPAGSTTWQEQQRQQMRQPPLIPSASAMATWVTQFVRRNRRRPFAATTTQEMVETTSLNTLSEPLLQSETMTDPSSEPLVQLENGGEPVIGEVSEPMAESEVTEPAEESAPESTSPRDQQE